MMLDELLEIPPFSLNKKEKENTILPRLKELTRIHYENCSDYRNMVNATGNLEHEISTMSDIPFLPVRVFKERMLKSVSDSEIVKTMTSSGTSGQAVSKIYLDKITSTNQQKIMVKIVNDFTGSNRMPMIILDCPSVVKDRKMFSARGAGILGFSIFGSKKIYAFNDNMQLDIEGLQDFLEKYSGERILLFGFTFMVWQYFYKELVRLKAEGIMFDLSNGILIHGGGWKKLTSEAVSSTEFHDKLHEICGLSDIHDYYGMVEQTGCIYMQCECGHLHTSIFSDIIIRNPKDFSECKIGEKGIIQVVSTIPESYPGHSLLTEDEGMIIGEDDCPCGRKGKYFEIYGRLKNAEIRGCSDTYAVDCMSNDGNTVNTVNTVDHETIRKISFLLGNHELLQEMPKVSVLKAFDERVINFCGDLSKEFMKSSVSKSYPDIASLGFWLRKSSINALKNRFLHEDGNLHIGRGIVFHIAPSNVPVNYAYSLFTGLLCGNANIVRVPSKSFPQVSIINKAIQTVLEKHMEMKKYICLVKYDRDSDINEMFSMMCNTRIIWGGDSTIKELRKSSLPPRATEVTFADRYSLTLIDSEWYMRTEDKLRIAMDFYNDTYLSDQNACTSPRVLIWVGEKKEEAKKVFWENLHKLVEKRYPFQPIMAIDKLSLAYLVATAPEGLGEVKVIPHKDNFIIRVRVSKLAVELMNYKGNSGYFYEYDCKSIMDLRDVCNDTHCQTIGVIGEKEILKPLLESGIKGVDRVVSVGHTMDFDFHWDGYNLVDSLTRTVVL